MTAAKLLFSPSVQVVDDGQGDVLFYVNERLSHRLSGKSVTVLTDRLIPLLDGSRTREEVCSALGSRLSESAVDALLQRLAQLRLLRLVHRSGVAEHVPSFIANGTDDPETEWRRLRSHPVTLVGPSFDTISIWASALREAGFESVRWTGGQGARLESLPSSRPQGPRETVPEGVEAAQREPAALLASSFVIAVDEDENALRPVLLELNRAALSNKGSWLLVRFTRADEAWIGPLFDEGEACYRCFLDRWRANLKSARETERLVRWRGAHRADVRIYPPHVTQVAAGVAYEAMRWLAGIEASPLASAVRILDLRSQESEVHRVLRHPLCAACGRADIARPVPWEEDVLRVEVLPLK